MISAYSADKPGKVYCSACWFSDKYNPLDTGRVYDFTTPFFEQFKNLLDETPKLGLSLTNAENSEYNNYSLNIRNCFLLFGSWDCEDSYYSHRIVRCKDTLDSLWLTECEMMYEASYCTKSFNTEFSFDSHQCNDSQFAQNCRGCLNCFGCINLRNKSNHIWNKPYTKDAYDKELTKYDTGSYASLQQIKSRFKQVLSEAPRPHAIMQNCNASTGDLLRNCHNCKECFLSTEGEDSAYCILIEKHFRSCYDIWIAMENLENCYELIAGGASNSGSKFGVTLYRGCNSQEYCFTNMGAQDCFGCVGLKQNKYCILNKQYTKEEYEALVPKIRAHMGAMPYTDAQGRVFRYGEFFPAQLAPFAYNESVAQQYFPLSKDEVLEQGYLWKEPEEKNYAVTKKSSELPDHIRDVNDTIIQDLILCEHAGSCREQCTSAFRIIKPELAFYRKHNLPLPRLCPNCRHYERLAERNPFTLWRRQCTCELAHDSHRGAHCTNEFETPFAPDRPEKIYCEACYQAEVA